MEYINLEYINMEYKNIEYRNIIILYITWLPNIRHKQYGYNSQKQMKHTYINNLDVCMYIVHA